LILVLKETLSRQRDEHQNEGQLDQESEEGERQYARYDEEEGEERPEEGNLTFEVDSLPGLS